MRVVVVPSAPMLLPAYAGLTDPVPDLRAAAVEAVRWLGADGPVRVIGDDLGQRVGAHLLALVEGAVGPGAGDLLVVADGSARRGEKAPGHLDERAFGFDQAVGDALRQGDPAALAVLDEDLGAQLLARGVPAFRAMGSLVLGTLTQGTSTGEPRVQGVQAGARRVRVQVDYDADPFGVQYWVVRWQT